jgi:hypothetical protein
MGEALKCMHKIRRQMSILKVAILSVD